VFRKTTAPPLMPAAELHLCASQQKELEEGAVAFFSEEEKNVVAYLLNIGRFLERVTPRHGGHEWRGM
jgi:hypothetical protein